MERVDTRAALKGKRVVKPRLLELEKRELVLSRHRTREHSVVPHLLESADAAISHEMESELADHGFGLGNVPLLLIHL